MHRTTLTDLDETAVAARAARGDRAAFDELHHRHGPLAWRLAVVAGTGTTRAEHALAEGLARTVAKLTAAPSTHPLRLDLLAATRAASVAEPHRGRAPVRRAGRLASCPGRRRRRRAAAARRLPRAARALPQHPLAPRVRAPRGPPRRPGAGPARGRGRPPAPAGPGRAPSGAVLPPARGPHRPGRRGRLPAGHQVPERLAHRTARRRRPPRRGSPPRALQPLPGAARRARCRPARAALRHRGPGPCPGPTRRGRGSGP
jgi:hypothetical protein